MVHMLLSAAALKLAQRNPSRQLGSNVEPFCPCSVLNFHYILFLLWYHIDI